jgi:hypothetical protein
MLNFSAEMELLTPAPWQAGSQFREVRDLGGRKAVPGCSSN